MANTLRYGATVEEWINFSLVCGLTADLLPVVSNPNAKIGESSKLRQLGKTPSRYNKQGTVGGILDWTTKTTTQDEITSWSKQLDYGICIITRRIRAIDVDVTDESLAAQIQAKLSHFAIRIRGSSPKFLAAFELHGEYPKRTIKTKHGIIEFLGNGQQFIAAGTHPSGDRYQWHGGDPGEFILLEPQQFEALWSDLQNSFGIEPSTESNASDRKNKLGEASEKDPTATFLHRNNFVLSTERDGRLHIRCPFESEHTDQLGTGSESGTSYFPAHTGGYERGHFKCLHAHCATRTDNDFLTALGITAADDFDDISGEVQQSAIAQRTGSSTITAPSAAKAHYEFLQAAIFTQGASASWIIKDIVPQADLAVVFGESGSGKSFFTLDLACCIARGIPFRNKKTARSAVAYIAAEGSNGFRNRLKAYAQHHEINLTDLPLTVLAATPNFMRRDNVEAVQAALLVLPERPSIIIVDTFAQVTPGANENSGEDVGRALGHCRQLRAATGSMIVLIHHSGKDQTKGARGWSGLRAAADAEIEITRDPHSPQRVATVTKLKDGLDNTEYGFKLDVVNLGTDSDGDPITSCVVVPTGEEGVPGGGRRVVLGDLEKLTLRVLEDIIGLSGEDVKINDLADAVVAQKVVPDGRDTRRQVALKALDRLVEKGKLRLDNGIVRRINL